MVPIDHFLIINTRARLSLDIKPMETIVPKASGPHYK